jgi:hypothetical protein
LENTEGRWAGSRMGQASQRGHASSASSHTGLDKYKTVGLLAEALFYKGHKVSVKEIGIK